MHDIHSLCLCPDFPVHNGCGRDAAGQGGNFEKATLTRRLNGVSHLTILTLVNILCHNLIHKKQVNQTDSLK